MKLLAIAFVLSAGPWNLQNCIDYALEHNISVQQSEINVKQKEITLNTARNSRLPDLAANASENLSFGRGLTEDNTYARTNTSSTGFSLGTSIPVFNGFEINNSIKMGRIDLAAATADLEKARNDIRVSVAQAYVEILYDKEILNVALSQVAVDSMLVARRKAMRLSGKASAADVVAQEATYAQSKLNATQARNSLNIAILSLTQLLELSSPEGFDVESPSENALGLQLLMNPEDIYARAVDIKPEIKSESLRLDYAEVAIKRAKGGYMPSLSLSGGIGSNFYTALGRESLSFADQMKNNFSQYVGVSLSVPIFSRLSTRNQVRSAKLSYDNQSLELEKTKKALYKEIQQAYYNAVASQSKYVSSGEAARSAEASYTLTMEKYENGKSNVTEYNEAKNRYLEAESNYLQARYECLFQTSLLNFYATNRIEFPAE